MFEPYQHPDTKAMRSCTLCADHLPLGPKPIFRVHPKARVALISQAPGRKAHQSGTAWDDQSGERLREWLDMDWDSFYHSPLLAVVPMGFCYPGKGKSGDLPPRPECAPQWHDTALKLMPNLSFYILIGLYAQKAYLGSARKRTLTETVRQFGEYLPQAMPLPHPSPLNTGWLRRNTWFESDVLPVLRHRIRAERASLTDQ